jgi:MtrB/PioB family decaheme-associated outer membrane protein
MHRHNSFRPPAAPWLAGALLLATAAAPALADEEEVKQLTQPESSARVGLGYLNSNDRRAGMYSGVNDQGGYLLFDIDYLKRDDPTGTWTSFRGRNLGLDSRELRGEVERQGNFRAFLDFSQIPRYEPVLFSTGLAGIGTAQQTINGVPRREVTLDTRRDRVALGFDKSLLPGLDAELRYVTENKSGSRMFGRGSADFLADPIDYRTQQLEATLGYTGQNYQLRGGYYGTAFTNANSVLDVNTGTDIALPPDSESHQFFLGGGYNFSTATRANFKAAYTRAKQNEGFYAAPGFPGNTQTSLNGRVDTTLLQAGVTSRPTRELSLLGNLRYEDRDDKTPRHQFIDASSSRDGFNTPFSRTTTSAKGEASYMLPSNIRLIGGIDYEKRKRSVLSLRQASWREENDETTLRLEARRTLSETLNGSIAASWADRDGSNYLPANNNAALDVIDPIHFSDRKRSKLRLTMDWIPVEALSVQFFADAANDRYQQRQLGVDSGKMMALALDANYTVSDAWQVLGWASYDDNRIDQSTISGANGTLVPAQTWASRLRNKGYAWGLGVRGKPKDKVEFGADLQYGRDKNIYDMQAVLPPQAFLPEIQTKRTTLRLFGQYAVQKNLAVRLDAVYDRFRTSDWTFTDFIYNDGSTAVNPNSSSTFLGISVVYRMW